MAIGTGLALVCAAKKASTWGTSVAVGALSGFRPVSWSADRLRDEIADKSYNGDAVNRQNAQVGRIKIAGKFSFWLTYEGCQQRILALGFGTAGTPTDLGGPGPYVHYHYRKNDMTGVFGTLCWYDGVATWEVNSFKVVGISLSCKAGEDVLVEVSWIGQDCQPNTATNANLSTVTETSTVEYVKWLNAYFAPKIAAQGASLTAFELSSWKVEYGRQFPTDDRAFTSEYMREIAAGEATCSIELEQPYTATTRIASAFAGTIEELSFVYTAAAAKVFGVWIPSIKWTKADAFNPTDKSEIPLKLMGVCEKAITVPSGYIATNGVVPYIQFTNTISTDALA